MLQIRLTTGHSICVPNDIRLITPFVLLEKRDWFEQEAGFVRKLPRPGSTCIDVGANYGVYTLDLAAAVGPEGRVLAYEPAAQTADYLAATLELNGYQTVEVIRAALADEAGQAEFFINENAELNSLIAEQAGESAQVEVRTLDDELARSGNPDVEFVKLDAEGAEVPIIEGGRNFFTEQSPVILFELQHGSVTNLSIAEAFTSLGYDIYRLVPGLDLLIPFDPSGYVDPHWLNLFACKPDHAEQLEARGLLARAPSKDLPPVDGRCASYAQDNPGFRAFLASFQNAGNPSANAGRTIKALDQFAASRDTSLPPNIRAGLLESAFDEIIELQRTTHSLEATLSLARIALAFGRKKVAFAALSALNNQLRTNAKIALQAPFLPPLERFDRIDSAANTAAWMQCSILEGLLQAGMHAIRFAGPAYHPIISQVLNSGYASEDVRRAAQLATWLSADQTSIDVETLDAETRSMFGLN